MPFTTGTANSWTQLTSAMNSFMTGSLGFTNTYLNGVAQTTANADSATWTLDGTYWNFDYAPGVNNGAIRCWMSTGNDGNAVQYDAHTGTARGGSGFSSQNACQINYVDFASPVDYFFFGDDSGTGANDVFFMVLKPSAGAYHHFWLGYIEPDWAAVRPFGAFCAASQLISTAVNSCATGEANASGKLDLIHYPYAASPVGPQTSIQNTLSNRISANWCAGIGMNEEPGTQNANEMLIRGGQQTLTGRTILAPNPATVSNQTSAAVASTNRLVVVGRYPDVFQVSLEGLNVEDFLVVGPDTYQVFPIYTRGSDSDASAFTPSLTGGVGDSGILGYAYRRHV